MTQTISKPSDESLTDEIKRKSSRMVNAFFDDWFETCKWCKFINHEHSVKNLIHCNKMLERRKEKIRRSFT